MTHPPIIQSYQQPYIIDDPIPAAQHRTSAFCCHIIASFPCLHPTAHKAISFLPSILLALSVSDQSPMFPIVLGQLINRFSSGVLDRSMSPQTCDKPLTAFTLINLRKIGENSTL
ncbi:hypothetical protein BHM03_00012591 [Ensete ventricosum]|nr:hypothetical protein BHM03_00012591 [Ensete ventricosum]